MNRARIDRPAALALIASLASFALLAAQPDAAAPAGLSVGSPPAFQAQGAFESVRRSVLQVRTIPLGTDSPYSYGSGFVVGADRMILTNYHVISSVVMDPDRYRLEFLLQGGQKGALSVVAIDVIHDLALLRGNIGSVPGLKLDERVPEKGVRGFSIGFPENQGITVTEGIVNGLSEDSARGAIHFAGPVNTGMSGGPTIDAAGRVFGVNIASLRNSQLLSLVIPAKAAISLVERARTVTGTSAQSLFSDLTDQLQANSRATLIPLLRGMRPSQAFGGFKAPGDPGEFSRCAAVNERDADRFYRIEQFGCDFKDETFVSNGLYMGHWRFAHKHVNAHDLGALRFARLEESLLRPGEGTTPANRLYKTRWQCQSRIVALSATRARAVLCLRSYVRFAGLYDVELKTATLDRTNEALISQLGLYGFGYPESMEVVSRFMESIAWKP